MLLEPLKQKFKLPMRSWRAPGVKGIIALHPKMDPCFWVDGLPSPFSVFFPVSISNLYTTYIYITALMISPPAGWSDSEQNIGGLSAGAANRFEKSNATRTTPTIPSNETITVRWNYRTGSYSGPIIGYDDIAIMIYWETISSGTVDSADDFEGLINPGPPQNIDGWSFTQIWSYLGYPVMERDTSAYVHGAASLRFRHYGAGPPEACEIHKTQAIGAGSRAAIFGFCRYSYSEGQVLFQCVTPVETLNIVHWGAYNWRRFGCRLNPGVNNTVTLYMWWYWGGQAINVDWIRWVHW